MINKITQNKKIILIVSIFATVILLFIWNVFNTKSREDIFVDDSSVNTETESKAESIIDEDIKKLLPGIEVNRVRILDNPVRIDTSIIIPKDNIYDLVIYFLNKTNNTNISNLSIDLNNDLIVMKASYKIAGFINPKVSLSIRPTLDKKGNIVLNIEDVDVYKIKISEKIIKSILNAWVTDDTVISVNDNSLIINKDVLQNLSIRDIEIIDNKLICDVNLYL